MWRVKNRKHGKAESLNSWSLSLGSSALAVWIGAQPPAGGALGCCVLAPGVLWLKDGEAGKVPGLHGICSPGAETDMSRVTTDNDV